MTGFDEVLPPDVQKSDSAILSRFQGPHERSSASRYEFSRLRKILNAREARTPFRTALEESVIRPDTLVIIPVQAVAISEDESESIRSHIGSGGSVLLLVGESTNLRMISSVNSLLEHFGISINRDSVLAAKPLRFEHAKDVMIDFRIPDGCRSKFRYPYGCTLNVQCPARPILSTGITCYPFRQPVGAVVRSGSGRLCVLGSSLMFSDRYLRGTNNQLLSELLRWFHADYETDPFERPQISDYKYLCTIARLAERCYLPVDEDMEGCASTFASIVESTELVHDLLDMHARLGVVFEPDPPPMKPRILIPIPELIPAVYPPSFFPLLRPPEIPLIDFDSLGDDPLSRLQKIFARFDEHQYSEFIQESGYILDCPSDKPKGVLLYALKSLAQ